LVLEFDFDIVNFGENETKPKTQSENEEDVNGG